MPRSKRRYSYYKADLRRYRRRRFIALLLCWQRSEQWACYGILSRRSCRMRSRP